MLPLLLLLACAGSPPPGADGDADGGGGPLTLPDPCGTGTWGDVQGTLFVDASATDGGDGSQDAPFRTITEAVDAAGDDDVIAIAAGSYTETIAVADRDLTLAGRCAALVQLGGRPSLGIPLIAFNADRADEDPPGTGTLRISGMTLTDQDVYPLGVKEGVYGLRAKGGTVEVHDVDFREMFGAAISLRSATGSLEDVRILDGSLEPQYSQGFGLNVSGGSQVTARRLSIIDQQRFAIAVYNEGTQLTVEGAEVLGSRPHEADWGWSSPVEITAGTLRMHDVRIADATAVSYGIYVSGEAELELEDVVIEDLEGRPCGTATCSPALAARSGVTFDGKTEVGSGGRITGTGVTIRRCAAAIWALEGGEVDLDDVEVSELGEGYSVAGVIAATGGQLTLSNAVLDGARGAAAQALYDGQLTLIDTEILDTQLGGSDFGEGVDPGLAGIGIVLQGDASLHMERSRIAGASGAGLAIWQADETGITPTATLRDVVIEDVVPSNWGRSAAGLFLRDGAVAADGLTVRDVGGPGILVSSGDALDADLDCTDCRVEDAALAGLVVTGQAATRRVRMDGCVIDGVAFDPSAGLSFGVLATWYLGAPTIELSDCEVSGTGHAALAVSGAAAVQVRDSTLVGGDGAVVGGSLPVHGNAVYATGVGAWDGETGLWIEDSTLVPGGGDTVLAHGASATLDGIAWEGGALRQQHCEGVAPVEGADQADTVLLCPDTEVVVTSIDSKPSGFAPIDVVN